MPKGMSPGKRKAKTGSTKSGLAYQLARARKTQGRLNVDDLKKATIGKDKKMSPGERKARTGSSTKNKQTSGKLAISFISDMMGKRKKKKQNEKKMTPEQKKKNKD